MTKYIFTYSIHAWTKRNPSKSIPCGASFDSDGARRIVECQRKNGYKISEIIVKMHYADKPLDWQNPISQRRIKYS